MLVFNIIYYFCKKTNYNKSFEWNIKCVIVASYKL